MRQGNLKNKYIECNENTTMLNLQDTANGKQKKQEELKKLTRHEER